MSSSNAWVVTVFKCPSSILNKTLVEFYRFVDELKEVRSLHFLIRDRLDDEVVVSFRVMIDKKAENTFKDKIGLKLKSFSAIENIAIDPSHESCFEKYVAWYPDKVISDRGQIKFNHFIDLLKDMSAMVIQMIENDYFSSNERVEVAHVFSWMLGCTEYGLLRTSGFEVGYYDRVEDKYSANLKQDFGVSADK